MSMAGGGGFLSGALAGGVSGAFGGAIGEIDGDFSQVVAVGVIGGVASIAGGGKFTSGFVTGAFTHAFNEMKHRKYKSFQDLQDSLGKDGVTFGNRALENSGGVSVKHTGLKNTEAWADKNNVEVLHEQMFYVKDGALMTKSFSNEGMMTGEVDLSTDVSMYTFGSVYRGVPIMAVEADIPGFITPKDYHWKSNNCQDFSAAKRALFR